jgi:hypothetical protein
VLAPHLARNPVCHSVVMQQRRERQRDANPCIRQWRESLLGMFVGGDARAASNTSNGHLLALVLVSILLARQHAEMENRSASHDESYLEKQKGQGRRHAVAET